MGALRQKCVPTYESFSNYSIIGFNMSYKFYLKEMDNESMFIEFETDADNNLDNLFLQLIGIRKITFMFFVVMQVEVQNVLMVMFVGKIEG